MQAGSQQHISEEYAGLRRPKWQAEARMRLRTGFILELWEEWTCGRLRGRETVRYSPPCGRTQAFSRHLPKEWNKYQRGQKACPPVACRTLEDVDNFGGKVLSILQVAGGRLACAGVYASSMQAKQRQHQGQDLPCHTRILPWDMGGRVVSASTHLRQPRGWGSLHVCTNPDSGASLHTGCSLPREGLIAFSLLQQR
eukprot:1153896-Pelagomonas_calceolata.AAC.1